MQTAKPYREKGRFSAITRTFRSIITPRKVILLCLAALLAFGGGFSMLARVARGAEDPSSSFSLKITDQNGNPVPGAGATVSGTYDTDRGYSTTILFSGSKTEESITHIPLGSYAIKYFTPFGYSFETMKINGVSVPPPPMNSYQSITFGTSGVEVELTCRAQTRSVFSSTDMVANTLKPAVATRFDIEVEALKQIIAGPFDLVITLDYSGSMAYDMNGEVLEWTDGSGTVHKSTDEGPGKNLVAKHNPASRYRIMEDAVRGFLKDLKAQSTGQVGFVFFGDGARTKQFFDIATMDVDSFVDDVMRSEQNVGGGTRTDIAFSAVKNLMKTAPVPDHRERKVVFFTDGEPGSYGLLDCCGYEEGKYRMYDTQASIYDQNTFRVMAEVQNQANIIKGVYGQPITTNEYIDTPAPYSTNSQYYPDMNQFLDRTYRFYGVSIDPSALGFVAPTIGPPSMGETLTAFYNKSQTMSLLPDKWKDSANWHPAAGSATRRLLTDNLDMLYAVLYGTKAEWMTNPSTYAMTGGDFSPENYASNKHGNYARTDTGLGAEIYTVGVINEERLASLPEAKGYITSFMENVASDGEDGYFPVSEAAQMKEAFETVFFDLVKEYSNLYLHIPLPPESYVFDVDGRPVGGGSSLDDTPFIDNNALFLGPRFLRSEETVTFSFVIYCADSAFDPTDGCDIFTVLFADTIILPPEEVRIKSCTASDWY